MNKNKMGRNTVKIFVGNLNEESSYQDLRALFDRFGTVVEGDIIKNFGFVHMDNLQEAKTAIGELQGYELDGRAINVELSTKGTQGRTRNREGGRRGFNSDAPPKIFIGNITEGSDVSELRALFEAYGEVTECDIISNFGFVHMANHEEAEEAIQNNSGVDFNGRKLRIEKAPVLPPRGDNRLVTMYGLASVTSDSKLKNMAKEVGPLQSFQRKGKEAVIIFTDASDADIFCKHHNRKMIDLGMITAQASKC